MPEFSLDLHNHTPASADFRTPERTSARDIVEAALDAGLHVYGATDHLTCAFAADLIAAAETVEAETGRRLLVVPGSELRVTYEGDEVHITALFPPGRYSVMFDALLGILGVVAGDTPDDLLPHVTFEYDPIEVCRIIDALGGIACVAHADRTFGEYRLIDSPLFERLCAEPTVAAIDLLDPDAYACHVECRGKSVIRCSDSHSCQQIGMRRSSLAMDDLSYESLRTALTAPRPAYSTVNAG